MTCTCATRICALCGHPLGLAWLTETRVDPLLGESRRDKPKRKRRARR